MPGRPHSRSPDASRRWWPRPSPERWPPSTRRVRMQGTDWRRMLRAGSSGHNSPLHVHPRVLAMTFQPPASTPIRLQQRRLTDGRRQLRAELALIEARAAQHADLNALAWVDWKRAARLAEEAQAAVRSLGAGAFAARPLQGVFISVKDLFNLDGAPTHAGTRAVLPDLGRQAAVVDRLEEAGAIVFAKTNMHEIALGATGENPWTGDVKNPYDPARQAGGSSSGSGVA